MTMRPIKIVLFTSLLVYTGVANAVTAADVVEAQQSQHAATAQFPPVAPTNDAQTQIEQAADNFDAFALQMPIVIKAKFNAFMKHGFRAILVDDQETRPGEEQMVQSIADGLQHLKNALEDDMLNYRNNRQAEAGNDPEKLRQEYHSTNSSAQQGK